MYELGILSFLMRRPMHGYLMAKIINDMMGPFAKFSNGRLYPLLAKLEADGLIVATQEQRHDRRQRAYMITDTGRERFHQLMLDTTSNPGEYRDIFWRKVPFLSFLRPAERLYLLDHYINYCQTHIFHMTSEMEDLKRQVATHGVLSPVELKASLCTMEHYQRQWRLDLEDTLAWRSQIVEAEEEAPRVTETEAEKAPG